MQLLMSSEGLMQAIKFFLFFIVLSSFSGLKAQGRAPAVEDFVGVETKDYAITPEGTEIFFNFENNVQETNTSTKQQANGQFSFWVFLAFVSLPFMMWLGINQSLKNHTEEILQVENREIMDNVEFLEVYQKEKQKVDAEEEEDEFTKKAS